MSSFAEQEQIRRSAEQLLAESRDGVFTMQQIYERLTDGATHATAARLEYKRHIIEVIRQIHDLSPVYYDRKSGKPLIWAHSESIPTPLPLRRDEVTYRHHPALPQHRATCDIRYAQMMLGILLLSSGQAHDLELGDHTQPSRRALYLRYVGDDEEPSQYLVWYDDTQQMLYGLHEFYSCAGVSIYSRLHFGVLEQPATLQVTLELRDEDASVAADRELALAAQHGDGQISSPDLGEPSVGLTLGMSCRLDLISHKVDELQRRLDQLGIIEVQQ